MKRRGQILLGLIALSGLASAKTVGGDMKAGRWQTKTSMTIIGADGEKPVVIMPAQTSATTGCYSQDELRAGAIMSPGAEACKITVLRMADGKVHMEGRCDYLKGAGFSGSFDGDYTATRLHLAGTPKSTGMNQKTEQRITLEARRLGDACTPGRG